MMKKIIKKWVFMVFALVIAFTAMPFSSVKAQVSGQYTNPLMNGADPTIVRGDDGYYYSGFGTDNDIYIKRSETLLGLSTAESHLVWDNPNTGNSDNNKNYYIWGPYIYRIDGAWYIYYSSSTENDFGYGHPSSYVLENTSADPFEGEWHLKGSNTNVDDFDGNASEKAGLINTESYGLVCGIVTIAGERYFTYTKYDYYANEPGYTKFNECPTIVKMENPWTLTGDECTVARPTYDWELKGDNIDEGAAVVEHDGKVYFAHSSSSFTNDNYCVGLSVLDLNGWDEASGSLSDYVMTESNWKKSTTPILERSDENAAFGPGSPLFVKSPDGTEDWLIYHAGPIGGQTSTDRRVRAQKINWTDDGQINLGAATNPDTVLDMPSGEIKTDVYEAEDAILSGVSKKLFNNTAKASGSGYVKYDGDKGSIEFNVDMDEAGYYGITFRYNNLGDTVNASLSVNGQASDTIAFEKNGTYSVDLDNIRVNNKYLNAGANTISLAVDTATDLALDAIIITKSTYVSALDATLSNGAFIEGDHIGGMYFDDATVTFTVDVPYEGYYAVELGYADDHSYDKTKYATTYVNGVEATTSTFLPTGGWDVVGSRIDNLYLKAGTNTISYVNHKVGGDNTGDVNYYYINVSQAICNTYRVEDGYASVNAESDALYDVTEVYSDGTKNTSCKHLTAGVNEIATSADYISLNRRIPTAYQAENGVISGSAVATDHLYYEGTGFVGGFENTGESVTVTANVACSGTHTVSLRYAAGDGENHTISLYINGSFVRKLELSATDSWDSWGEAVTEVYLYAGKNTVEFRVDEGDTGRLNIDEIIVDEYSLGSKTVATSKLISGEVYVIKDSNSGLSLDIDGYSPDAGREIHLWSYLGNNNQKWKLVDLGNGYVSFKGTYGSKRIAIQPEEIEGVTYYFLYTADENSEDLGQQWKLEKVEGAYKIINRAALEEGNELVLSVFNDSKETGARLFLAPYENKASQLFTIDGGLPDSTLYVRELESNQNPDEYASYGSQYTLVAPMTTSLGQDTAKEASDYSLLEDDIYHYEAEELELISGASLATDHKDYTGSGFVGGMYNGSARINLYMDTEAAGTYSFTIRYANGHGTDVEDKYAAIVLNSKYVKGVELPKTGSWDDWSLTTFELDLEEGFNTIGFVNSSSLTGHAADVNYDYIEVKLLSTSENDEDVENPDEDVETDPTEPGTSEEDKTSEETTSPGQEEAEQGEPRQEESTPGENTQTPEEENQNTEQGSENLEETDANKNENDTAKKVVKAVTKVVKTIVKTVVKTIGNIFKSIFKRP